MNSPMIIITMPMINIYIRLAFNGNLLDFSMSI
jgi:hypothetical protein